MLHNILNKLKSSTTERNLIICNNKFDISELKEPVLKQWMVSKLAVWIIYSGKFYNPPFFKNIVSLINNSFDDIKMIWNMTLLNGRFAISNKFKSYFMNTIIHEDKNNKIIIIHKTIYKIFRFSNYRTIDFIIAGAMKGGTTSAVINFNKHPEIYMNKHEVHYFDHFKNYQRGIDWYKSQFDYSDSKKMIGDKAPDVMFIYSSLPLLQTLNPFVKILLFLRNPIERSYSHWKMLKNEYNYTFSYEFNVNDELNNRMDENCFFHNSFWYHTIKRGFYYRHIMEILKFFPRENIYITISENVKDNIDEEYQKIFKFLEVSELHTNFTLDYVSKTSDNLHKNSKIYKKLKTLFTDDVRKLEKFLGYKTNWW